MDRTQAVVTAAEFLLATESAIDGAYGTAADLAGRLVRLRVEANLSSTVGQDALGEVTAALFALGEAQAAITRAHGKLKATQVRIGCRAVATGGRDKDNQDSVPFFSATPLQVAA